MARLPGLWRRVDLGADPDASVPGRAMLSTVGVTVQGVVRFAYSVLIARTAGPAVLAPVNAAISTALFASLLWPTATAQAASAFIARGRGAGDAGQTRAVATLLGRWTLLSSVLLGALTGLVWAQRPDADAVTVVTVGALVVAYSGYGLARAVAFGAGQVRRATGWDVLAAVVSLGGLVAVLAGGLRAWLLAPLVLGYGVYAVANWPRRPRAERTTVEPLLRAEVRHFVVLGVLGTLAVGGLLQLTMVVAERADTPVRAGQYAAVLTLATPASLLARSLSLVLLPAIAESRGRGEQDGARRATDLVTRALLAVSVAGFGAVALAADLLVPLLFGPGFGLAVELLPPMLLAVFCSTAAVGPVSSLLAAGRGGVRVVNGVNVTGFVLGCLLWVALVPAHGVDGVVWGYLGGAVVMGAVPYLTVWRGEGHRWGGLTARLVLAVLLVVAGLAVRPALAGTLGAAAGVVLAVAFVAVWALVARRDLALVLRAARRSTPGSGRLR
jgi:putative peptidoglycan lipid II flippase